MGAASYGSVSDRGVIDHPARSGSFEVELKVVDLAGTDTLVFRAVRDAEARRGVVTVPTDVGGMPHAPASTRSVAQSRPRAHLVVLVVVALVMMPPQPLGSRRGG